MAEEKSRGKGLLSPGKKKVNTKKPQRKTFSERQQERLKQEKSSAAGAVPGKNSASTSRSKSTAYAGRSQTAGRPQSPASNRYQGSASSGRSPAGNRTTSAGRSQTTGRLQNSRATSNSKAATDSGRRDQSRHTRPSTFQRRVSSIDGKPYQYTKTKTVVKPHPMDYTVLFLILFLFVFGLIMIYSTSSYKASLQFNNSIFFVRKQMIFGIAGVLFMIGISRINYHLYKIADIIPFVIYGGTVLVLILTLILAVAANGSKRWLNIFGLSLQPSEVAKLAVIMILAHYISEYESDLRSWQGIVRSFLISLPILGLVGLEDLSTAIIIMGIVVIMIFIASPSWKPFIVVGILGIAGVSLLVLTQSYRMDRINTWINPLNSEKGMQTMQGLYAIGSGGFLGKGLGQSMQKMGFIPEPHNDMIFSIVCEEFGLFGAIGIIILFAILIYHFYKIAKYSDSLYGSMIAIGVIAHVGLQTFVNIGVVTNTIPNTGVPLPFISYGGTSLFFLFIEMGLVLSVSRYTRVPSKKG